MTHPTPKAVELAAVIATVDEAAADPVERISLAARVADDLRQTGELLADHYVTVAREAGASWSDIGVALGVSKQAAQQRYLSTDFPLFTPRARQAIVIAENEATELGHNFIGLEHVTLGLAQVPDGIAGQALSELGVSADALRDHVRELIGAGPLPYAGPRPFTPRAKRVLAELAPREAVELGHSYVGTEHVLLATCAQGRNMGAEILRRSGVDLADVRATVLELVARAV